jgi:hypothetical protein
VAVRWTQCGVEIGGAGVYVGYVHQELG